jgi:hypothetical protein
VRLRPRLRLRVRLRVRLGLLHLRVLLLRLKQLPAAGFAASLLRTQAGGRGQPWGGIQTTLSQLLLLLLLLLLMQ